MMHTRTRTHARSRASSEAKKMDVAPCIWWTLARQPPVSPTIRPSLRERTAACHRAACICPVIQSSRNINEMAASSVPGKRRQTTDGGRATSAFQIQHPRIPPRAVQRKASLEGPGGAAGGGAWRTRGCKYHGFQSCSRRSARMPSPPFLALIIRKMVAWRCGPFLSEMPKVITTCSVFSPAPSEYLLRCLEPTRRAVNGHRASCNAIKSRRFECPIICGFRGPR